MDWHFCLIWITFWRSSVHQNSDDGFGPEFSENNLDKHSQFCISKLRAQNTLHVIVHKSQRQLHSFWNDIFSLLKLKKKETIQCLIRQIELAYISLCRLMLNNLHSCLHFNFLETVKKYLSQHPIKIWHKLRSLSDAFGILIVALSDKVSNSSSTSQITTR